MKPLQTVISLWQPQVSKGMLSSFCRERLEAKGSHHIKGPAAKSPSMHPPASHTLSGREGGGEADKGKEREFSSNVSRVFYDIEFCAQGVKYLSSLVESTVVASLTTVMTLLRPLKQPLSLLSHCLPSGCPTFTPLRTQSLSRQTHFSNCQK